MAIKGSLKEASLPDVLQLLTMGAKTGCLSVTDKQSFGYIYFDEGRIVYASLLNRRDRFGDILVREGIITREQLDAAIEEQSAQRDGRRIGEILKAQGVIDQAALQRYIRHQIEEAVYHLFTWSQGTFYFEPEQKPEGEPIQVSIDPESLLLEGARRVDEWSQVEKKIPSLDIIFAIDTERSASLSSLDLTPEQEKVLPYLDGNHSVWGIMEETALPQFDVGKALFGLIAVGLVRRVGRRGAEAPRGETRGRIDEHRNLGVAFYKTTMLDEAEREFSQVERLDPDALDAPFYLGLVALRRGDMEAASQRFRRVIEGGGKRAAAFNNLAFAEAASSRTVEAVRILDEALEAGIRHPKIQLSKALLQLRMGDPSAALDTLEALASTATEELPAVYYSTRALAEAMAGNVKAAVGTAGAGVKLHPASAVLANNAGVVVERSGDVERARDLYERAFEQDSGLPQASKNLGDLLYREGMYDQAAEAYERALKASPVIGGDTYAKLGNVYYKSRDREKAIEMWERALELNPTNEVVKTNLELVRGSGANGG